MIDIVQLRQSAGCAENHLMAFARFDDLTGRKWIVPVDLALLLECLLHGLSGIVNDRNAQRGEDAEVEPGDEFVIGND